MLQCPKCKKSFGENYAFCEECGVKLIKADVHVLKQQEFKVFDRVERSVFFRITRSYTWVILVLSILGFIGAIFYLFSDIRLFLWKDTSVSAEEIKIILAAKKAGRSPAEVEEPTKRLDPELLARLDKEIYELIILLPKTDQEKIGIEKLRGWVKDRIGRYNTIKEKIKILREANGLLTKFSESERTEVLGAFFNMKAEKESGIERGRTEAKIKMATIGGTFFALIMIIAAFSLILVLLAIERNTRKG